LLVCYSTTPILCVSSSYSKTFSWMQNERLSTHLWCCVYSVQKLKCYIDARWHSSSRFYFGYYVNKAMKPDCLPQRLESDLERPYGETRHIFTSTYVNPLALESTLELKKKIQSFLPFFFPIWISWFTERRRIAL
jgi:hypothetical protein